MRSAVEDNIYENEELKEKAVKVVKCEDAVSLVREYETLIKTKKNSIVCITYRQGDIFKRFKAL